jgi:hypothetical protein
MADFSHLKAVRLDTSELVLWGVVGEPILVVRPAGESNKSYFNERLRAAERMRQRKAKINAELVKQARDLDRELFPKFIIVGWKNVVDANGAPVQFTRDECVAFLAAIDDDLFDTIREYCQDSSNFREVAEGVIAAGNSPTA